MAPPVFAPARDLERRKQLRLRLRRDLVIESQRYEGRVFFVLKDPVSLRYYRLKHNEHFLLQFLDGKRTLEDAQKAYERQYRPERLPLECSHPPNRVCRAFSPYNPLRGCLSASEPAVFLTSADVLSTNLS